jgi:hypothetical protein
MPIPNGLVAIWFLPIGIKFFYLMHLYALFAKSENNPQMQSGI